MEAIGEVIVGGRAYKKVEEAFDALYDQMENGLSSASVPLSKAIREALQLVARKMEQQHSGPWNGRVVNDTQNLQKRSGGIKRIRDTIKVKGNTIETLEGTIGTAGFAIHETGGVITAKRSKYLTIPLPAAMDGRGVPLRKRARDWDKTFVARSRRGNLLIFRKEAGGGVTPLYLLKPSVRIPARLGLEKALINDALPYFERKAFEVISNAIG
ncbi:putative morphogenesis protein [Rhizobium phage RHph_I4]|nr:putative morphogenesis protein [Rhizobium phage RHph_I4]